MAHTKMTLNEKTVLPSNTTTPADVEVRTGLEFNDTLPTAALRRSMPSNGSAASR